MSKRKMTTQKNITQIIEIGLDNRKMNLHEIAHILRINVYITPQAHQDRCYDMYGLMQFLKCEG